MIGIVWDYFWELSDLLYFIKLFPICQPLSPTRRKTKREISVSIAEGLTPKSLAGKIAPASIPKPIIL